MATTETSRHRCLIRARALLRCSVTALSGPFRAGFVPCPFFCGGHEDMGFLKRRFLCQHLGIEAGNSLEFEETWGGWPPQTPQ